MEEGGDKAVLTVRICEGTKNNDVDFQKVDLDDLTYLQIFAKCVAEDLPAKGKRSVLQKTLEEHWKGDKGTRGDGIVEN
eukprot:3837701-Rhodomonas_salina.2